VTVAGARGPGLRAAALALAAAAALFIAGCASGPPKQMNNACRIFAEKSGWEKHTRRAARKWRADAATLLAIMHQESRYLAYHEGWNGYARGTHKRKKWLLGVAKKVDRQANRYRAQLQRCGFKA